MPEKKKDPSEFALLTYLKALEDRDLKTLDEYYNEDLTFKIGHNSFSRSAVMSLLETTKQVMKSSFVVHNMDSNGDEIKAEITEKILFLRDSDFLFFLEVKEGETVELKTINHYRFNNGKISTIDRAILSMSIL